MLLTNDDKVRLDGARRCGFTLVEVLIVISIIALLLTVSFAAFANFIVLSKEKATANTILKLHKILQQRKDAFDRLNVKSSAISLAAIDFGTAIGSAVPSVDVRTAETILRKQRFQRAFPQRYEERDTFNGLAYGGYFSALPARPDYESSAFLYLAITAGETFGAPQVDDDAFSASEIKTLKIPVGSVTVDLKYFVDAWGQPLRFYRWPTSLIRPDVLAATADNTMPTSLPPITRKFSSILMPSAPSIDPYSSLDPLAFDFDDPGQRLSAFLYGLSNSSDRGTVRARFKIYFSESTFSTPLIVSAGPDRALGLLEPNNYIGMNSLAFPIGGSNAGVSDMLDNITNLNQRNKGN